ncbi:hypothetical protein CHELA1G2_20902 [Hyphomicrobiales bacterium]|nr:hypothetical protein CHELA1G2_20902 [Hyphomicrobiales bacterium]
MADLGPEADWPVLVAAVQIAAVHSLYFLLSFAR